MTESNEIPKPWPHPLWMPRNEARGCYDAALGRWVGLRQDLSIDDYRTHKEATRRRRAEWVVVHLRNWAAYWVASWHSNVSWPLHKKARVAFLARMQ